MLNPHTQEARDKLLLESSIERVINSTLSILDDLTVGKVNWSEEDLHAIQITAEDWGDLKWAVIHVFNEARNEAFKRANP